MEGNWTRDDIEKMQQLHNAVMEQAAKHEAQLLQLGDRKGRFHEVATPVSFVLLTSEFAAPPCLIVSSSVSMQGTKWIRTSLGELVHVMVFDDDSYQ
jgi:hypothetical protein